MGETVESLLAMICAHSAIAEPTKAHMVVGKVNYNIVNSCSAKRDGLDYLLLQNFTFRE